MKTLSNTELQHSIDATVRLIQGDNSLRDRILTAHLENLTDEQRKRATDELTIEPMESTLDRAEFDARVRGQDGPEWVEWSGGECPAPEDNILNVEFRDGASDTDVADAFYWRHDECGSDIVRYRDWTAWEQSK